MKLPPEVDADGAKYPFEEGGNAQYSSRRARGLVGTTYRKVALATILSPGDEHCVSSRQTCRIDEVSESDVNGVAHQQFGKDFDNGHYTLTPQHGIRAFARVYAAWVYGQTVSLYRVIIFEL